MAPAPPADQPELPENPREGRLTPEVAERTLVRKPQIGDTRPAPAAPAPAVAAAKTATPKQPRRKQTSRAAGVAAADRIAGGGGDAGRSPRPRAQRPAGRALHDVRPGPRRLVPGRRAGGPQPHRALRLAARRRRQPDPRQHLRRAGPERPARHGGGVRRHRHAEERRALPRRRAVRRRGHRASRPAHRADPARPPADRLPGDEEPDRRQGSAAHPGGVAAGALRGADPQLEDVRDLQAPARRRAQAAAFDPRPGEAVGARPDRAHRRRARHRGRVARRHAPAPRAVGGDRRQGRQGQGSDAAVPRAGARRAGHPRGVQRRLPPRRDRRSPAVRRHQVVRVGVQPRARRPHRVLRRRRPRGSACTSSSTSTSRCTRPSIARCGCRRAVR